MEGFLEAVSEVDMEEGMRRGATIDTAEDLRIEVVVVVMMVIGVLVVLHFVTVGPAIRVAEEVLSWEHAIYAVNQGTEHLTVQEDVSKEKDVSKFARKGMLYVMVPGGRSQRTELESNDRVLFTERVRH